MEVPQYWAEARTRHRQRRSIGGHNRESQVTVRRFGWSNVSQAEAEALAERRANEALQQILAGDRLIRRERKVPYNGSTGVPIREEVLSRHGVHVITRNSYGAHCLNTPDVLFADIDFRSGTSLIISGLLLGIGLLIGAAVGSLVTPLWGVIWLLLLPLLWATPISRGVQALWQSAQGGPLAIAQRSIERFLDKHPHWNVRLYATPNGLRLLATHQTFDPNSPEVKAFFRAVQVDRTYQMMCQKQQCFRARLTAKPWRIGIQAHLRPRPGVWPIAPERMAARRAWVLHYEQAATAYAACHFLKSLGSGVIAPAVRDVIELHDQLSRATRTDLPLA